MKILLVALSIPVALFVIIGLTAKPETVTQKIDRVCGYDNNCRWREEVRVVNKWEADKQADQDQQIGN